MSAGRYLILGFAPEGAKGRKPVAVVLFGRGSTTYRAIGVNRRTGELNADPYCRLFPRQSRYAWAYLEWLDWLHAVLVEERVSLTRFTGMLADTSTTALQVTGSGTVAKITVETLIRLYNRNVLIPERMQARALPDLLTLVAASATQGRAAIRRGSSPQEPDVIVTVGDRKLALVLGAKSPTHIQPAETDERSAANCLYLTASEHAAVALTRRGLHATHPGRVGYQDELRRWLVPALS